MSESSKPWQPSLIDLWTGALLADVGISIKTNDRRLMQAQLYRARQAEGTKEMEDIAICVPAVDDELWMVKKEVLDPAYEQNASGEVGDDSNSR